MVDHISTHLDDTLDLQTLAGVAHFSPWHFHRLLQAMTGETLADFLWWTKKTGAFRCLPCVPVRPL